MPAGYAFTVARVGRRRAHSSSARRRRSIRGTACGPSTSCPPATVGAGWCRARAPNGRRGGLRAATRVGEPVTLLMTRRMLLGLKQRAEGRRG